ncbi:MAG: hypothetical protein M3O34_10330 [Chloroflexota bacterium]|nr:hypothetical protein [Chloroflexota bacterium]
MAWVKLSDDHYNSPQLAQVSTEAKLVHTIGKTHCARFLTDGAIARAALRTIASQAGIGTRAVNRCAGELVAVGLWVEEGDGYFDPAYLTENPTGEKVLAEREETRRRVADWRKKQREKAAKTAGKVAENPPENGRSNSVTHQPRERPDQESDSAPTGQESDRCNASPYPSPYPYPEYSPTGDRPTGSPRDGAGIEQDEDGTSDRQGHPAASGQNRTNLAKRPGESQADYVKRLRDTYSRDTENGADGVRVLGALVNELFGSSYRIDFGKLAGYLKKCGKSFDKASRILLETAQKGPDADPLDYALKAINAQERRETGAGGRRSGQTGIYGASVEEQREFYAGYDSKPDPVDDKSCEAEAYQHLRGWLDDGRLAKVHFAIKDDRTGEYLAMAGKLAGVAREALGAYDAASDDQARAKAGRKLVQLKNAIGSALSRLSRSA